ncbi:unnamed protein product [Pieris macdunnoughi]|uniref:MADF domain-containing protein n=1 Tax=Pieris macdunnoughi TaxID=345717 RepID=A0A821U1Q5_9NEOP|nr:unnamed protein product [Pieris macdunnoughi]
MEKFIEAVRLQPCLWNPLDPDYREMHVKDEAWTTVVEIYNNRSIANIQVAKMEWKKLRDNHRDALKRAKLGKNKLLPAQITTWKYAKAMQFLEPHMKYRITENIEIEPSKHDDVSTTEEYSAKRRCIEKKSLEDGALESFFKCMLQSTKTMPYWMQTQVKKKIFSVIIEAEEQLSSQGQSEVASEYESEQTIPLGIVKAEIQTDSDDCT